MKRSLLLSSALLGLVQTTLAVAGPDFTLIEITRKNQLRHQAEDMDKAAREAKRAADGAPATGAPTPDQPADR